MPILGRSGPRLLRTVGGKPHATAEDHDQLVAFKIPNSTLKDVDINADPLSSDDEAIASVPSTNGKTFQPVRQIDTSTNPSPPASFKRPPAIESPGSPRSKRSFEEGPQSSDTDGMLFSSQGSSKRRKASRSTNIHAPARYGKTSRARAQREKDTSKKLRQPRSLTAEPADVPTPRQFIRPKLQDISASGAGREFRHAAGTSTGATDERELSSPASSLSSPPSTPGIEEVEALNLPPPQPYASITLCAMCGQSVSRVLKEDFEDQFTPGKQLSYKWQQRFCDFHKQHDGKAAWAERGYPEIDWGGLEKRMRRFHARLLRVMEGGEQSYYRERLHEQVQAQARMNTSVQVYNARVRRGAVVGYYGSRGEKVMTDHIVAHLSEPLRKQSSKDKLVAKAGVSGGVSGFIQAVLVPELAQQLVMEDMEVDEERAREVIAESTELGDSLHPEAEETVTDVAVEVDD